jgi:hypothetical protein
MRGEVTICRAAPAARLYSVALAQSTSFSFADRHVGHEASIEYFSEMNGVLQIQSNWFCLWGVRNRARPVSRWWEIR